MPGSFIRIETKAGNPIVAGDTIVTPVARSLILRLPGRSGGLIWNRPVAVEVQSGDGEKRTLPVPDATRQAQLRLFGVGLVIVLLVGLMLRQRRCKCVPCTVG